MREMAVVEMLEVRGGGFWTGLGCGLGIVASFWAALSPDPFSKISLITHGGTLVACVTAFESRGEAI